MTEPHGGFTGSRVGMTPEQKHAVRLELERACIRWWHHGDCVGSDKDFHGIARAFGCLIEVHPPNIDTLRAFCNGDIMHPAKDYVARDHDIVKSSSRLLATPSSMFEIGFSGTWLTVRYARKLRRPVTIIFPDGSVKRENGRCI